MLWLYGPMPSSRVYGILMILSSLDLNFFMGPKLRVYHDFVDHLFSFQKCFFFLISFENFSFYWKFLKKIIYKSFFFFVFCFLNSSPWKLFFAKHFFFLNSFLCNIYIYWKFHLKKLLKIFFFNFFSLQKTFFFSWNFLFGVAL